jgi:hypothetical protein
VDDRHHDGSNHHGGREGGRECDRSHTCTHAQTSTIHQTHAHSRTAGGHCGKREEEEDDDEEEGSSGGSRAAAAEHVPGNRGEPRLLLGALSCLRVRVCGVFVFTVLFRLGRRRKKSSIRDPTGFDPARQPVTDQSSQPSQPTRVGVCARGAGQIQPSQASPPLLILFFSSQGQCCC